MKQIVLDVAARDQEIEHEELGAILTGLVDDDSQEQTFVAALVVVTVLAGLLLIGLGVYLSIFWGI
ncbi:hypothetical protein SAMN05216327_102473 [Dyadobacter sp. SG02]|uniref:hypothetical protein n=1 Tax=Dyadobacter sp. SG02 TaxID=1855291 RepID=UPI0008CC450F|nr:hypothetical protein [Dyadobacter sp. SG02]SEI56292.1 hypothetical protein SAMN05216327_102473 [Dyadobacter sp. SG02]